MDLELLCAWIRGGGMTRTHAQRFFLKTVPLYTGESGFLVPQYSSQGGTAFNRFDSDWLQFVMSLYSCAQQRCFSPCTSFPPRLVIVSSDSWCVSEAEGSPGCQLPDTHESVQASAGQRVSQTRGTRFRKEETHSSISKTSELSFQHQQA